jgi:hypothetical protein
MSKSTAKARTTLKKFIKKLGLGYMLFIAHLCNHMLAAKWWWDLGHSSAHCLEGWVLGVGMSTLGRKRFCTPRIGDPQVPMTLDHPRCGFAASGLIPRQRALDRCVPVYPSGPH